MQRLLWLGAGVHGRVRNNDTIRSKAKLVLFAPSPHRIGLEHDIEHYGGASMRSHVCGAAMLVERIEAFEIHASGG